MLTSPRIPWQLFSYLQRIQGGIFDLGLKLSLGQSWSVRDAKEHWTVCPSILELCASTHQQRNALCFQRSNRKMATNFYSIVSDDQMVKFLSFIGSLTR